MGSNDSHDLCLIKGPVSQLPQQLSKQRPWAGSPCVFERPFGCQGPKLLVRRLCSLCLQSAAITCPAVLPYGVDVRADAAAQDDGNQEQRCIELDEQTRRRSRTPRCRAA